MAKINNNYLKLPGSYLFSTIAKKVKTYGEANPDKEIIRLGIGDVTQPIAPDIIRGYAPDLGYDFLRHAIAEFDFKSRGCDISEDEIFVSDGAKCDCGNIQEIFSTDNVISQAVPERKYNVWRKRN